MSDTPAAPDSGDLSSAAWLMEFISDTPGTLVAANGRVAFIDRGEPVFDVAIADLTVTWWGRGNGGDFEADGNTYRISFTRPDGAPDIGGETHQHTALGGFFDMLMDGVIGLTSSDLGSIGRERAGTPAKKAWMALLA